MKQMYLIIEPNSDEGEGSIEIYPERREIAGYNPVHRIYQGWGERAGFSGYFVIQFEEPFETYGVWRGDTTQDSVRKAQGNGQAVGAYVSWANRDQPLRVRVGTSFTSEAQARKNLAAEIPHWDFNQVRQQSEQAWENELRKIRVSGGSEEQKIMFYTALYHSMILPREFSDADRAYVGFAGTQKVYQATGAHYYADFSMWDTFRAVHPLQTLINPERSADMIKSLIAKAEQGGWLPIFPAWNSYTSAMIGDHVTATIGDAWMKGIDDFDQELAYRMMRKNAFEANTDTASYRSGQRPPGHGIVPKVQLYPAGRFGARFVSISASRCRARWSTPTTTLCSRRWRRRLAMRKTIKRYALAPRTTNTCSIPPRATCAVATPTVTGLRPSIRTPPAPVLSPKARPPSTPGTCPTTWPD